MIRVVLLLWVISLLSFSAFAESISTNHPSPYVRMHANDAVKWQRWDKSVLQRAKKENKLIFISSGYYACHWCHVMRKESFSDKETGDFINKNFIPIKIDRELNPALDSYLMNFVQYTQGYGGWPLNVFVTPQGYPLTGLVYLPRKDFLSLIMNLQRKWLNEQKEMKEIAWSVFEYTQTLNDNVKEVSAKELKRALKQSVEQYADDLEGGFGNKAKFPLPHLMLSLLSLYENDEDKWLGEFVQLTLSQMVENGLYDSIGGGFFRYTVDPGWQTPHYEKMLYTNAAMIKLYVKAYKVFENEKWLDVAKQTLDFVIREMGRADGGYVSTLNAQDNSGEEGGNYLWEMKDLLDLLSVNEQEWIKKKNRFITPQGTQKILPIGFLHDINSEKIKQKILRQRSKKPLVKDDKFIISWNAYLFSAMIDLLQVTNEPEYRMEAVKLYEKLKQKLSTGLVRNKSVMPQRFFEDYAFSAYALWQWQNVYKNENDKKLVTSLLRETIELFSTADGWKKTDLTMLPVPGVNLNIPDDNLPSAAVIVNRVLDNMNVEVRPVFVANRVEANVVDSPLEYSSYIVFVNDLP